MCRFSGKTDNFHFFGPNLPRNGFSGRNFENLSLDLESAPLRYHVCQFSIKMENFKFGEIASLRWGCCRELGGGWNELGGGGWSWVEVEINWVELDGASWRWVHGLVIPCETRFYFHVHENNLKKQPPEVYCKKKVFLKISRISQENAYVRISFQ